MESGIKDRKDSRNEGESKECAIVERKTKAYKWFGNEGSKMKNWRANGRMLKLWKIDEWRIKIEGSRNIDEKIGNQ